VTATGADAVPSSRVDWPVAVRAARDRIAGHARRTPVVESAWLSDASGARVFLKLENLQHTGSFKLRGALNTVLALSSDARARGVITASTGNHGAAVAFACGVAGATATIYVPHGADRAKLERIEMLGGQLVTYGTDSAETERRARDAAAEAGRPYVSPYNDVMVAAGQGTIGLELADDPGSLDTVFVAVGGGGLVAGIAGYLDAVSPGTRIVGCSPRQSAVMAESIRQGRIVELESGPTLSDGTAGGVEPDALTFEWCRTLVDEWVLVDEEAIALAMRQAVLADHLVVEGAAGVAMAAVLAGGERWRGARVAVVVCGGNVGAGTLAGVLAAAPGPGPA
jgi:threonine dehydratase